MQYDMGSIQTVASLYFTLYLDTSTALVEILVGNVEGDHSTATLCDFNISLEGFVGCSSPISGRYVFIVAEDDGTVLLTEVLAFT